MEHEARYWHTLEDGRIQCDLCPRECRLRPGQRGFCFVRANEDGRLVLTTYGRSSGFCVDPIEKKPLNHFLPGATVLVSTMSLVPTTTVPEKVWTGSTRSTSSVGPDAGCTTTVPYSPRTTPCEPRWCV